MIATIALGLVFLVVVALAFYGLFWLAAFVWRQYARPMLDPAERAPGVPPDETAPSDICAALPSNKNAPEPFGRNARLVFHCVVVVFLTLGLLIPLHAIKEMIEERAALHRQAIDDIAEHWGKEQTIRGPALVIPFIQKVTYTEVIDKKVVTRETTARAYRVLFPASLDLTASVAPERRARGIYEYVVYTGQVAVAGSFHLPRQTAEFGENAVRVEWENAWLALGVEDLRAIASVEPLLWNGQPASSYQPGTQLDSVLRDGFHAGIALDPLKDAGKSRDFSLSIALRGSNGIYFTPVGQTTRIALNSEWPHPKFLGAILPRERTIDEKRFSARWEIPHLSRSYPQSFTVITVIPKNTNDETHRHEPRLTQDPGSFIVGAALFEPVWRYSLIERAVKYAILFIGLTFIALLSFELTFGSRLHVMQYGLVGVAMVVFYLILLSLAEHTHFLNAFLAASAVSVLMNAGYVAAALRSAARGGVIAALLAALYALLYAILQMEEHALLMGTALVVSVVALLMFLTRNLSNDPANAKKTIE